MSRDERWREVAAPGAGLRAAKPDFDSLVVVCAKCGKRQGLPKRELRRSLKRAFRRENSNRNVRIVATGCLGPCPKRMIAVATSASLSRSRVLLLDPSLPAAAIRCLLPNAAAEHPARASEDAPS